MLRCLQIFSPGVIDSYYQLWICAEHVGAERNPHRDFKTRDHQLIGSALRVLFRVYRLLSWKNYTPDTKTSAADTQKEEKVSHREISDFLGLQTWRIDAESLRAKKETFGTTDLGVLDLRVGHR